MAKKRKAPEITAERLKEVRAGLRETQAEFAERLGINQGTVSRWERGEVQIKGMSLKWVQSVLGDIERVHPQATKA